MRQSWATDAFHTTGIYKSVSNTPDTKVILWVTPSLSTEDDMLRITSATALARASFDSFMQLPNRRGMDDFAFSDVRECNQIPKAPEQSNSGCTCSCPLSAEELPCDRRIARHEHEINQAYFHVDPETPFLLHDLDYAQRCQLPRQTHTADQPCPTPYIINS